MDGTVDPSVEIALTVNGASVRRARRGAKEPRGFHPGRPRAHRTHVGCEQGRAAPAPCAWTARSRAAASSLAVQCDGAAVETIEGATASGEPRRPPGGVRRGQRAAMRLLHAGHAADRAGASARKPCAPTGAAIRAGLSGNYCRCTGYHAIVEAILATVPKRRSRAGERSWLTRQAGFREGELHRPERYQAAGGAPPRRPRRLHRRPPPPAHAPRGLPAQPARARSHRVPWMRGRRWPFPSWRAW